MIEQQNTIVVIPARLSARRLPGKPLADIWGEPMIVHVWRRAMEAKIGHVLVAAGDLPIAEAVRAAGGDAITTEANLPSGSDRVAAALALRDPQGATPMSSICKATFRPSIRCRSSAVSQASPTRAWTFRRWLRSSQMTPTSPIPTS